MTPQLIVLAIIEIVKLINHYHETLPADQAAQQTARFAKVLDFLFGWIDKLGAQKTP